MSERCAHCGLEPLYVDGVRVDGCFKNKLLRVSSACCGHGDPKRAYIRIVTGFVDHIDVCGGTVMPYRDWNREDLP